MKIEIVAARIEEKAVLANLLELYAHDFSEFYEIELGADGRFGYERLSLYWSVPERFPYFIRVDGQLAGFVLVAGNGEGVRDVAEFFVVRRYRRRGVGMLAAHEVWRRLGGQWQVRVMEANAAALRFWGEAVAGFVVSLERVETDGRVWRVFSFGA